MVRGHVFLVLISASRASAEAEIAEKAYDHLPSLELISRLFAIDDTPSPDHHRQLVKNSQDWLSSISSNAAAGRPQGNGLSMNLGNMRGTDLSFIQSASSPKAAFSQIKLNFCGAAQQQTTTNLALSMVAGMGQSLKISQDERKALVTDGIKCFCSMEMPDDSDALNALFNLIKGGQTPQMQEQIPLLVEKALPDMFGSNMLCSSECQSAIRALFKLFITIEVNVLETPGAASTPAGTVDQTTVGLITSLASSTTGCMCSFDYTILEPLFKPMLPMDMPGDMTAFRPSPGPSFMMTSLLNMLNTSLAESIPLLYSSKGMCASQCRAMVTDGASLASHVISQMDQDQALLKIRGPSGSGYSLGKALKAVKKRMLSDIASNLVAYAKDQLSCMCGYNVQWPTLAKTILGPLQSGSMSIFASWRSTLNYAEQVTTAVFSKSGLCGGTCAEAGGKGMKLEMQVLVVLDMIPLGRWASMGEDDPYPTLMGLGINGTAAMDAVNTTEALVENLFPCLCAMDWASIFQQTIHPTVASIMAGNWSLGAEMPQVSQLSSVIGKFISSSRSCDSSACRTVMTSAFQLAQKLLPRSVHKLIKRVSQSSNASTTDLSTNCSTKLLLMEQRHARFGGAMDSFSRHLVWLPLCTVSLSCPPVGISSYKLSYALTASGTLSDFDAKDNFKAGFANKLVKFLASKGVGLTQEDVSVVLSPASVRLQSSLSTGSALDKDRMSTALNAMNASEASMVFGLDVVQTEGVIVSDESSSTMTMQYVVIGVAAAGGVLALVLGLIAACVFCRKGGTQAPKQFDVEKKAAKPKVVEVVKNV